MTQKPPLTPLYLICCKPSTPQRLQILSFNQEGKLPTVIDVLAKRSGLVYDVSTNQAVNEGEFVMGVL